MTAVALALDGVDGKVARRTGTSSALGARFDMEVDAFLILVLSAASPLSLGPWVLAIGAMRYAFVAAAEVLAWLRAALPPSYRAQDRRGDCRGSCCVVAASGAFALGFAAVLVGLCARLCSCGRSGDVRGCGATPAGA